MTTPLNLFITGGGSSAAREATRQAVARGHQVTLLTSGAQGAADARADGALPAYSDITRAGELTGLLRMAQANVILHLAPLAFNSFPLRAADAQAAETLLTAGTQAVLAAAAAAGIQFVVCASSTAVYGDLHGAEASESSEPHDESGAFRRWRLAEKRVLSSSVPACVLRAGFTYGPDDAAMRALDEALRRGRTLYLGNSHSVHNWVHAADVARAALLAAEQQPAGEVFNVVDDHPTSASAFASSLAAALGVSVNAMNLPLFARNLLTSVLQCDLLGTSARASNAKLKERLGWQPKYANHASGLEQVLLHWRAASAVPA